ncbi:helix-turn-helix domain-containing protein [Micromonospora sp. NBC_01699]|uniref:AraC family transcriptional regulator n=1 Tax=Micromonospora sp. NBC_01699 TaxID=2975984 RepID=UPI002E311CA8|nr:helix-turn-helix domain-containing protein [Micromonospora sp. NBC_01699]
MYREVPSARVRGAVLWWSTSPSWTTPVRILPDGCMDLIWSQRHGLLVAGPDTTAQVGTASPGERYVGLRFPPGTGPAVFGLPAYELRDRRVPLTALWSEGRTRELDERAAYADRPERLLESVAAARLGEAGGPDPVARPLVARLDAGGEVARAAADLGLGPRQLHRRSLALFGYGPKTLARILRMQRALSLLRTGVPAADAAARTGYADQPHLSREIRALTGLPPRTLLTTTP